MSKLLTPGLLDAARRLEQRAAEYRALNKGEIGNRIAAELRDQAQAMKAAAGCAPADTRMMPVVIR